MPRIDGLRIFKPMDNFLTAYQMNTGDKTWSHPVGETAEVIRNNPRLAGIDPVDPGIFVCGAVSVQCIHLRRGNPGSLRRGVYH